tara:strand:- start:496 stop:1035 length:540 start_codon:yes stop_codon:yes gene_type:complete
MARRGRPRKQNKPTDPMDIRIGAKRHPNGSTVRPKENEPGPHERHIEIRKSMGYDKRDQCEVDHILFRLPYVTEQQRNAGLRFERDWVPWAKSIGVSLPKSANMERSHEHQSNEPTENDERAKERYLIASKVLKDAGEKASRAVFTAAIQRVEPPDEIELIHGLNALVAYYEKGLRRAA